MKRINRTAHRPSDEPRATPLSSLSTTLRHGVMLAALLLLVGAVTGLMSPAATAVGLKLAVGSVIGDLKETATPSGHDVRDVSDAVTFLDESFQTPLDQLMRKMNRRKPATNVMIEWQRRDRTPPRRDTASAASTAGAAGGSKAISVSAVAMWRKNDLIALPANGTAPGAVLLVTAVNTGAGTLTVYRLPVKSTRDKTNQDFSTVPAIAEGEVLVRLAVSKTEGDAPSASRIVTPEYLFNLVHTFDAVAKVTDHRKRSKNYGPHDWTLSEQSAAMDLRRSAEYNAWWGVPSITTDPTTGEQRMTMAGIDHFCTQEVDYSTGSLTEPDLIDWQTEFYTGNAGARTRAIFAGSEVIRDIDKVAYNKLQHGEARQKAGLMISTIGGRFGQTAVIHHPGFDDLGFENIGFCVDLSRIWKAEMQALDTIELDLKKSAVADAEGIQYIEKSTIEVSDPSTLFKIIAN